MLGVYMLCGDTTHYMLPLAHTLVQRGTVGWRHTTTDGTQCVSSYGVLHNTTTSRISRYWYCMLLHGGSVYIPLVACIVPSMGYHDVAHAVAHRVLDGTQQLHSMVAVYH